MLAALLLLVISSDGLCLLLHSMYCYPIFVELVWFSFSYIIDSLKEHLTVWYRLAWSML